MTTETAPDGWSIEWLPATIIIRNAAGVPQLNSSIQPSCLGRELRQFRVEHGEQQMQLFEEAGDA